MRTGVESLEDTVDLDDIQLTKMRAFFCVAGTRKCPSCKNPREYYEPANLDF